MEGRKEAAYRRSWRLWRSSDAHRNLSRQDLLRESRSWRYSRRKILRPDEFFGLGAAIGSAAFGAIISATSFALVSPVGAGVAALSLVALLFMPLLDHETPL